MSVWMSLNANDALDRSRPEWLKRTAQGAWVLAIAQPIAFAAYLIALIAREVPTMAWNLAELDPDGETTDPAASPSAVHLAATTQAIAQPSIAIAGALALIGVFFLISAVGLVCLTTSERRYPDRLQSPRLAARIATGVGVVVGAVSLTLGVTHLVHGWPAESMGSWLLLIVIEITFATLSFTGWLYLRPIARRGGRGSLAKLCGYLLLLPLLAFAKAAPFIGLWFLYLLMPLATFLPLAYLPLSTVLFVRFALLLQRAAPHAADAWAAETKGET